MRRQIAGVLLGLAEHYIERGSRHLWRYDYASGARDLRRGMVLLGLASIAAGAR